MKRKIMDKNERDTKDFFDLISPSAIKFYTDYYICGDTYRCVWAIRDYPPSTADMAILSRLGDREGVTLRIYSRQVDGAEQRKIIHNATRNNKLLSASSDIQQAVAGEDNLRDVTELLSEMRKDKEPLLHCAVYLELKAESRETLDRLKEDVMMELTRNRLGSDRLTLRQKEGFICVQPAGYNILGSQFERVLPASSAANLFPFNYSGKTDPEGFYIGRDKYGTNIIVDFDRRSEDKTNSNILILGNSGQGKSYLLKLLLTNLRESGKSIICLDAESEYRDLTENLGGCYIDLMSGEYIINPLEPKEWSDLPDEDENAPEAFRRSTRLSRHISFLKDFFRAYKDFSDAHIDAIEILLSEMYKSFGITDDTDFSKLKSKDYPIMSDLYAFADKEYKKRPPAGSLFTKDLLREICLGLNSMCVGAESRFFNGHTNITDDMFLCFGVKGLMESNRKLKDALLFNILSYMNHMLIVRGNTVASIDEFYLFLSNLTAVEYIRNAAKRVRKKDSSIILASQNTDDFLLDGIKEYTKPLFSIPSHVFIFNPGTVNPEDFTDMLQIEDSEFDIIRTPQRGVCLYKCGNERYLLMVTAPDYKAALFGSGGGR